MLERLLFWSFVSPPVSHTISSRCQWIRERVPLFRLLRECRAWLAELWPTISWLISLPKRKRRCQLNVLDLPILLIGIDEAPRPPETCSPCILLTSRFPGKSDI